MGSNLLNYSGIVTKSKAMGSRLITIGDFHKISELTSVAEFINFLKTKEAYADIFADKEEGELHRGQIEQLLARSLYKDYARLHLFCNSSQRTILSLTFLRFEVTILKMLLQHVFNDEESPSTKEYSEFFHEHSDLNVDALNVATNIEEFTISLKNSKYYSLFKRLLQEDNNTIFDYEMQLDIYYFMHSWKITKKKLKGIEQKAMVEILGRNIDLLNVMWIYRTKKYYHIDSSHIFSYIIPIQYKINMATFTKLIESENLDDFFTILNNTYYQRVYNIFDSNNMELSHEQILLKVYRKEKNRYKSSMAPVNYFMYKKEQEIKKLIIALECIRYKLPPNDILDYLQLQ